MDNRDLRARILRDLYERKQRGLEILTKPEEYANILGVSPDSASFNIQYLLDARLVRGGAVASLGTTKKWCYVTDMTNIGVDTVEGRVNKGLDLNYNVVNVNAPITESQFAVGREISQARSLNIDTFDGLEQYLDQTFPPSEIEALKTSLRELEQQINRDEVKPSTIGKIQKMVSDLGPTAAIVIDVIIRLLGFGR